MAIAAIHNVLSHLPWQWVDTQGAILFLCMLLVAKFMWNLPPKNSPPGPFPLPIVGNILSINLKNPISSFCQIVEKYGDISMVDLGQSRCILLTGYKGFKEAFVERADSFTDRPSYPLNDRLCKGLGLISSNGHMWKQQRRFALSTLRYFGVGKKTLKNSILDESGFLCKAFQMNQGTPFDPHYLMNNSVGNIICSLVFGHRFEYDDPKFNLILKCSDEVFQLPATFWGRMYNQYPNLMHFLPGKHQSAFSSCNKVKKFIQEEVKKHKEDRDASNPRDYIDCYLDEIEKCRDSSAGFTEENLLYCVMDLFGAGTETTSKTLIWAILYMAKYPEIQENVHAEIDRVIGPFRQPSMEDRATMPYTYAVLHEIQRFGNVITFTPPRVSNKDTTVAGYKVSKGVMVLPMLKPILQDKKEYATSDQFNPRHFLDEDGKFLKRENFIPFSIGKRMCPGEQLAWMELFLFFTSLLQRFTFCPPEEQELSLESVVGITTGPKPFKICAVPR